MSDEDAEEAKAICAECPVRQACLEHALAHREREGVWGGATERERRRILTGSVASRPEHRALRCRRERTHRRSAWHALGLTLHGPHPPHDPLDAVVVHGDVARTSGQLPAHRR